MPQPTKNAPKKRPVPTKRSPVIKAAKNSANDSAKPGAEDDVTITALKLVPGQLSPEMDAYFKKCDEKLGFVPNVLKAFAFDNAKLEAFVDYRQQLVQNAESLSKLEIEMIATAVSSQNRCFYCITAHGNGVRQLGDPVLGEQICRSHHVLPRGGLEWSRPMLTAISCEHLSGRIIRPKSLRLFPENA